MKRIQNNMARVYARRVLELAAMSAATMASTTALQAAIEKPPEWSTIDLAEERRKFGENFSTLGKSAISRVWAAGEMNISCYFCRFIYICWKAFSDILWSPHYVYIYRKSTL
jgi:hypothetical protein